MGARVKSKVVHIDIETRPDVIVIDGGDYMIEPKGPVPDHDGENKQLMAYAAGMDFGPMEARVMRYMGFDTHIAMIDDPAELGTEMHKRLEVEFFRMDEMVNHRQRAHDLMLRKSLDYIPDPCEIARPGKRKKKRDWDQRDRKHRGR